jgi:hypothetical protein
MTITTLFVIEALLADPGRGTYGLETGRQAGLPDGAVHPIPARLEAVGWRYGMPHPAQVSHAGALLLHS